MPESYIGEPEDDLKLADQINKQIQQLTTPELRTHWTQALKPDLELVKNYSDWKASGHHNFEKWGQEHNKQTGYGPATTYSFEK